jgi:23S rRNA pseudouridine955/2504/2580 synthase
MIEKLIDRHSAGQRLDRYLRKAFEDAPLALLFATVRKKKVRVNGKVAHGSQMLAEGDRLHIYENLPESAAPDFSKKSSKNVWKNVWNTAGVADARLRFALERPDFVVCDKPSGLASQPGSGVRPGESLVELLEGWAVQEGLDFKPALAHRLDLETSGLVVAALSAAALRQLAERIRTRQVRKEYVALVQGHLEKPSGTIRGALREGEGEAVTHWQVVRRLESAGLNADLVRVGLETGKKHQIRIHFAGQGHPLAGDSRYGDFAWNRELRKRDLRRLFLHAALLEFEWEGKKVLVQSDLPQELKKIL